MSRLFDWWREQAGAGLSFRLKLALGILGVLNLVAIYLFFFPPGGSKRDLVEQESILHNQIVQQRVGEVHLKKVAEKIDAGGVQTEQFANRYFLPRRQAFEKLATELLRMSSASGLRERERTYTADPIEGTEDLTLVTVNANYQGTYADMMQFVNQVDHSPQLLILDTLSATPQQQGVSTLNM